jgi:hypothetical protein
MDKVIIVVAGNHREFGYFLSTIPIGGRQKYVEASYPERIRGLVAEKVITVGTWYERKDGYDILEEANSRVR